MAFRTRGRAGSVEWEIDTTRLNEILNRLPGNVEGAVRATAFAIEATAKTMAPLDTGALRDSIYTRVGRQPTLLPEVAGNPPRVELPRPEDEQTAHVGPSVEYGLYQELGTTRMAAHPYLGPAVNRAADELAANMGRAVADG